MGDAPASDETAPNSLLRALIIAARHRGIDLSEAQIRRDHRIGVGDLSTEELLRVAQASGLRAEHARLEWRDLMKMQGALPAILILDNGGAMVLLRVDANDQPPTVALRDPHAGELSLLVLDELRLARGWSGEIILVKRDYRISDEAQPFGLGLIVAALLRDRRIVRDVTISAIILGVLALGPIMFWRLLIDRVLYYHSL
ncbi:MAG: cysteine peptidase family C39 domain-containing protein, partial [Xanthobacteraceae bacterium]